MRIQITVFLEADETANDAQVISVLKGVGIAATLGDADGRRWILINGTVDEAGLTQIALAISAAG